MAQTPTYDTTVTTTNTVETENKEKISKIIKRKRNQNPVINRLIESITKNTVRVETNLYTSKGEFVYAKTKKPVKKDTPYHIHYTKNLKVYYMTRLGHSQILSELILKVKNFDTLERYNKLNQQKPMILKPSIVIPNRDDYLNQSFTRYFAKKTNEESVVFEISEKDYETSPLYDYAEVIWFIAGKRNIVKESNIIAVNMAEGEYNFSGLKKVLPDFQFYREAEGVNKKEEIEKKLGQINDISVTQNQTQTQSQNRQATGYGADSAPPTGTMTGGGGGTGGGSY